MSKIQLIYFNGYAKAEPMRMILHKAGVDYDNHMLSFEDWGAFKKGELPADHILLKYPPTFG